MFNKIKKLAWRISKIEKNSENIISENKKAFANDLKNPKILSAGILIELNNQKQKINSLHDVEFQVFSQWGDDGIIQYLINKIEITDKCFVEFGVENYTESNTRFLMINNNWSGLVLDGSENNIDHIKNDDISWSNELYAKQAFITKENINQLLSGLPFGQNIGILSIDIDGNDYWIWKEISSIDPVIVICEYNSVFGINNAWTLPYKADFVRPGNRHPLHIFYGTSLLSICDLAEEKGYYFIGCNSHGNNAYFIRKDKIGSLKPITPEAGFVISKFRESVDENNERISAGNRYKNFSGQTIFNTRSKSSEIIK